MKYNICSICAAWIAVCIVSLCSVESAFAQPQPIDPDGLSGRVNTVFTSIPFLRINPDGRTGGMGDVGIATDPDYASIFHNSAKLAFTKKNIGFGLTYTPWLRELVNDIYIAYLGGYKKLDDLQSIGLSLRYFSLGSIQFTNLGGEITGEHRPNEFAIDLAYARKLSDNLSLGLTLKYVRSDLARNQELNQSAGNIVRAANAAAADIGFYYQNNIDFFGRDARLSLGTAISNIGNKVSYTDDAEKDFLPINWGIGSGLKVNLDDYNTIAFAFDVNKLLVPTPDTTATAEFRSKSLLAGMFGSFGDAPGGFKEELQELMYSVGAEYWYREQFSVRAGYFHEHQLKGNRKFVTMGVGLRYSVFGLDFSYVVPTSQKNHPLSNTLRFTLSFNFDALGNDEG